MQITKLNLKNFRCFSDLTLTFSARIVLIEGKNGTGKTSVLEALHYLCYLRSFRTYSPQELMHFGNENFFIKAEFTGTAVDQTTFSHVQVGFSDKRRLVKVDQKVVSSYKELMDHYRIITLTEDDLGLIKEGPDVRRAFIDQAVMLYEADFITLIKSFKGVVDNRNALLKKGTITADSYALWTEQLWELSFAIENRRRAALASIEQEVTSIIKEYFESSYSIKFIYKPKKKLLDSFKEFEKSNPYLMEEEKRFCRSLVGVHLDDFAIQFEDKKSKNFASRGQQKLIVLLVKIAQIRTLATKRGPVVFLLDDFMTDFDQERVDKLLPVLMGLGSQLIFTSPIEQGYLEQQLCAYGAEKCFLA